MDALAEEFEQHRTHLRAVAYRLLGSVHEADDAVQEAWLRLARLAPEDRAAIENLPAWLTTTTSRLCLDQLRARGNRREADLPEHEERESDEPGPEADAVLVDQVGAALQVVLASLSPAERLAFVLHDLFAVPFDEVGTVMGRSGTAVRQLASRGRRRVRGESDDGRTAQAPTQRAVVEAFLAAARAGEFEALLELLDPGAAVRADAAAVAMGVPALRSGATEVAGTFNAGAKAARLAVIDGLAGLTWSHQGQLKVAFVFHLDDAGRVVEIEQLADPDTLAGLRIEWPRRGE